MKVDITDILWAITSMFIVGWSYSHGWLIYGIVLIYVIMAVIFFFHIARKRATLSRGISAFATVKEYHEKDKGQHYYPVVTYTTEEGRKITSTYTVQDRKKRYEIGEEVMVCYDPDDPVFFYFPEREGDMTKEYTVFIVAGGIIALILLIIAQFI